MPSELKRNGRAHRRELKPRLSEEMCSVRIQVESPGTSIRRELPDEFKLARQFAESNFLISSLQPIRQSFLNFGFKVNNENSPSIKKPRVFETWWDQKGDSITRFAFNVWREWLTISNVIVYWRDGNPKTQPLILRPEDCRYSDKFGIERLWVRHNLTEDDIKQLPPKLQPLYRGNTEVEIRAEDGQYFKVLKLAGLGHGLSHPAMVAVFDDCEALQNISVGDKVLALESINLVRQHTIGHETRYGIRAGSRENFINPARMKATELAFKGKKGLIESFANFDQLIKYFYLDPKWFDPKKMQGAVDRILWWTQPIGQMALTRGGVAPFLMDLIRVQAAQERSIVGPFITDIIKEAFSAPVDIKVNWSNRVFRESRLQADLLKFALVAGLTSQKSTREEIGYDDKEQREQKAEEEKQPDAEKLPVYDPAHGVPGAAGAAGGGRGRPLGQPDEGKGKK